LVAPFSLFVILILFEAIDSAAFGPIMGQIREEFQLTGTQLGFYSGLGALFGILTAVPVGELIRRQGYRVSGTALALVIVVGAGISFYAPTFIALIAGRVMVTTGARGCLLVGQAGGTTVAPKAIRGTAWALMNSMISIGGALGAALLGGYVGANHGWRSVMLVMIVITLAIAAVYAIFLRMPSSTHADHEASTEASPATPSVNIYRLSPIYLLGLAFALTLTGLVVNSTFAAVIVKDRWDLGAQFVGNALGLGYAISVPFLFVGGIVADRLKRRRLVLTVFILIGVVGPLLQVVSLGMDVAQGGPNLFTLGLNLCYVSGIVGGALIYACAPDLVPQGTNLGPVYAVLSVISMSGWFLEPIMAGAIWDATGSSTLLLAIFSLSGLGGLFLLWKLRIR
jgi:MFS family permease